MQESSLIHTLLSRIVPDVAFNNGFLIDQRTVPYYSLCQASNDVHWSDDMNDYIAESSKNHFIDRYNRRVAMDCVRTQLRQPGASYIDIGCASGYMLEEVIAEFPAAQVVGSDFLAAGLVQCHRRHPSIPLFQMDATSCPIPDETFDAITCLNVLEHIADDRTALKEMFRLLKPGGVLAVTVPMNQRLYDMIDEIHFHVRRYGMRELREKVLAAGFDIVKMNYFGVVIYPAFYLRKKFNRWRFKGLSADEKMRRARQQTSASGRLRWMEKVCEAEYKLGSTVHYPYGVRSYAMLRKP